jgi:tripartite-type tricarboxylate transporter receptor subunit TctC
MTIGFAAGGGVDLYGRTIGRYLTHNLPGSPSLLVQNQPGAGGVVALNDWTKSADRNGLSLTVAAQSQTDPDALNRAHAKYNPASFKIVGGLGAYSQGLFIRKDALGRLNNRSAAPVVMGMVGATLRGGTYQVLWGASFLGWNVRWVRGYPSTAEVRQALERGEIDMATFGATTDFQNLLKSGTFTVVTQTGQIQNGERVKRPVLGDAPIFSDLVRDKIRAPLARRAFRYWEAVSQIGMWVALPPGAPDKIVETYVKAFDLTIHDPHYRSEYSRIDPDSIVASKAQIDRLAGELAQVTPETLDYLDAELARQGFAARR